MKLAAGNAAEVGRDHIIKRPRLTRLLDETEARVILLVAPAGYGKTTLAREWLADPVRTAGTAERRQRQTWQRSRWAWPRQRLRSYLVPASA